MAVCERLFFYIFWAEVNNDEWLWITPLVCGAAIIHIDPWLDKESIRGSAAERATGVRKVESSIQRTYQR